MEEQNFGREQIGIMSEENKTGKSEEKSEKSGLKLAQIVASALAAITAAFLGSTLGVEGTVAGAGAASVITTVGSELYLRSLRRTKEAAARTKEAAALALAEPRRQTKALRQTAPAQTQQPYPGRPPQQPQPTQRPGWQAQRQRPVSPQWPATAQRTQIVHGQQGDVTTRMPMAGNGQPLSGQRTVFIPRPEVKDPETVEGGGRNFRALFKRFRWPIIIGTSLAGFAIALLAITGIEAATGNAISGGSGNTVGHLFGGGSGKSGQTPATDTPATTDNQNGTKTKAPSTSESRDNDGGQPSTGNNPSKTQTSSQAPTSSNTATPTQTAPSNGNGAGGGSSSDNAGS